MTPGAVLAGTYEVTRLLGEGGMGSVWEARHLRLERKKVAIKVLHGFVASDGEAVNRFQREANIASRLGHPNIIQVHDFNNLESGAPYLVLEYLEGESLNDRLRQGPVPLPQALAFARQIGSALQAAHNEGIVHRDLKPHNVFLCPSETHGYATEQVKVLDFGISKIQGSDTVKTQTNAILGTPQYMSPEQAKGAHRDIDHRTDVFALGAIVYEMLSGRAAFLGDSIPEVMFKVVYEEPPPLAELAPGLPANVLAAVAHALVKDRDQRCESAAAFVEALTGDPLNTLRGGPATAAVNSPQLSSSLAAAAASRSASSASVPGVRAASPEAFAATMATGDGRAAPGDAFGPTMTPVSVTPPVHVAMLAANASPAAAMAPAGMPVAATAALDHLHAAHGVSDTTPVVERPRHVSGRPMLPYAMAGVALIAAIAAVVIVALPGGGGTSEPVQPVTGGVHATGPADPGPTEPAGTAGPTASASGADTPAPDSDMPAQAPDAGATASASGATNDPGQRRDPDTRPSRTGDELPAEVREQLAEAEAMVTSNPGGAITRARKILGTHRNSSLAAAIMTRAYCVKGDLGAAVGGFGRVKDRKLKRDTRKFCKDQGLTLQD